jgi:hypothetical protein
VRRIWNAIAYGNWPTPWMLVALYAAAFTLIGLTLAIIL